MPTIEVRGRLFFQDKNVWLGEGERFAKHFFQKMAASVTLSKVSDFEDSKTVCGSLSFGSTNLKETCRVQSL